MIFSTSSGTQRTTVCTLRNPHSIVKPLYLSKRTPRANPPNASSYSALRKLLPLAPFLRARYNSSVTPVSQSTRLKVLFFGRLKDLIGRAEDSVNSADAATIEQLFALYAARNPELAKYRPSLVASRNQEFAAWDTPLHPGDEVAFLPPVSGG
jgi:molybdopterin synthase sulfur carrier subunit